MKFRRDVGAPLAELLALLKRERIDVPCDIELEYAMPKGFDAVKEVGVCNDYCRVRCAPAARRADSRRMS